MKNVIAHIYAHISCFLISKSYFTRGITESENAPVKLVTSQKQLMTLFKQGRKAK